MLLLHGLGDQAASFVDLAGKMALPWVTSGAVVAPMGLPFGMDGGMWFPSFQADGHQITSLPVGDLQRVRGLRGARERVHGIIRNCLRPGGHKAQSVFLLGFAQGGVVALDAALSWDGPPLGGVMAMSSELVLPECAPRGDVAAAAKQLGWKQDTTPVFVAGGQRDPQRGETLRHLESLEGWLCAGSLAAHSYDRPFGMLASPQETRDLYEFLAPKLTVPAAATAYEQMKGNGDFIEVTGKMDVPDELKAKLKAQRL